MDIVGLQNIHGYDPHNIHSVSKPYPPISRYYPWIRTSVSKISNGYFFEYPWIISGYEWIYIHGYEGAYPLHYFGYFMDILWIYIHGYGGAYPMHYFGYIMDILRIYIHGYGGAYPLHYYGYNVNFTGIFRHTEGDLRR